jgi:hypothetical protein
LEIFQKNSTAAKEQTEIKTINKRDKNKSKRDKNKG